MRRWYCVAVRVQVPKKASAVRFALHPVGKILLVLLVLAFTTGLGVFTYYYVKYSRLIETKLAAGSVCEYVHAVRGAAHGGRGRYRRSAGDRDRPAPQRLHRIAQQSHGLFHAEAGRDRRVSGAGFVFQARRRRHQVRGPQGDADHFAGRQHGPDRVHAGARADLESVR